MSAAASATAGRSGSSRPHSSVPICRYYLQGNCKFGSRCVYEHARPRPAAAASASTSHGVAAAAAGSARAASTATVPCRFFLQGNCMFGENCRFSHAADEPVSSAASASIAASAASAASAAADTKKDNKAEPAAAGAAAAAASQPPSTPAWSKPLQVENTGEKAKQLCPIGLGDGTCYDPNCPYLHGEECPCCGCLALIPGDKKQNDEHIDSCVAIAEKRDKEERALERSKHVECSVCLEEVLSKAIKTEARFGILPNCSHPFCISCIRDWRSRTDEQGQATRSCPLCRTKSWFVIPSNIWVDDPEEKQELIDAFKGKTAKIDCRHFKFGEGDCPFGDSCFYRHASRTGEPLKCPPRRRRQRADGAVEEHARVMLRQFLDMVRGARLAHDDFDDDFYDDEDEDDDYYDDDDDYEDYDDFFLDDDGDFVYLS